MRQFLSLNLLNIQIINLKCALSKKKEECENQKVLNNNVVIAQNDNEETILMGLGLGFGKKAGEVVEDKKIEKIFALKVTSEQQNFFRITFGNSKWNRRTSILTLAKAKTKFDKTISDTVLVAFADHLNAAIIREKDNITIKNFFCGILRDFSRRICTLS